MRTVYCLAGRRRCWQRSRFYPLSPYMTSRTAILPLFAAVGAAGPVLLWTGGVAESKPKQAPKPTHTSTRVWNRHDPTAKNSPCLSHAQLKTAISVLANYRLHWFLHKHEGTGDYKDGRRVSVASTRLSLIESHYEQHISLIHTREPEETVFPCVWPVQSLAATGEIKNLTWIAKKCSTNSAGFFFF